jgi:hypothetical protein
VVFEFCQIPRFLDLEQFWLLSPIRIASREYSYLTAHYITPSEPFGAIF